MLYPLKFTPRLKERIWGGNRLRDFGKKVAKGEKIGESWELSAVEGDLSVVSQGELKDNNIQELIEVYMGDLVGDRVYNRYGVEFPLLVKLIDARENLSVQVHPNDEVARERHNSYGKTEMWYVLGAEPGASLYAGFNREVTEAEYLKAVEEGTVSELLNKIEVKTGDTIFIPAGTVHAIGAGVLVLEIQQTSDITYRIDDWGRVDDSGNPRELHTELAVGVIDYSAVGLEPIRVVPEGDGVVGVVECDYFTTNMVKIEKRVERRFPALDSFVIYTAVEGSCELSYSGGRVQLQRGETVLVPAQEESIVLTGDATLLETYIE